MSYQSLLSDKLLDPQIWEEITAAQRDVAAYPDSREAHLRLARALVAALSLNHLQGITPIGNNVALAESAKVAYERALELAPNDATIYVEYLDLLWNCTGYYEPLPENFAPTLRRGLALAPDDKRLLQMQIQNMLTEKDSLISNPSATPPFIFTLTPKPTSPSKPTLKPTSTPVPTTMPASTTVPEPSPVPIPTSTRSPITTTPIPAPPPDGGNVNITVFLVLGALLGVLLLGWGGISLRRKR